MIELPRRQFLRCLTGVIAAPAVVRVDSLMRLARPLLVERSVIVPIFREESALPAVYKSYTDWFRNRVIQTTDWRYAVELDEVFGS